LNSSTGSEWIGLPRNTYRFTSNAARDDRMFTHRAVQITSANTTRGTPRQLSPSRTVFPTTSRRTTRAIVAMAASNKLINVKRVEKSDSEWAKTLDKMEFQVLRKKGTEPARTGMYDKYYPKEGHFVCAACRTPLYSAQAKFDSGCGWPAFDKCYEGTVKTEIDNAFGMRRVEILCAACDGHLGHVFENEGLTPTMERHCVNSVSVKYVPENIEAKESKVVEGGAAASALGALSPIVFLLGVYILSDVLGRTINAFTAVAP